MWQRMKRVFRSMFGWMISAAEDPELILEQNIRDLNDQVPKMNESIAMVKANVTLLEKENQKYKNDLTELTSKVKAAIQANRDDIATTYATQLQTTKSALLRNEQQWKRKTCRERDRETESFHKLQHRTRPVLEREPRSPWSCSTISCSTTRWPTTSAAATPASICRRLSRRPRSPTPTTSSRNCPRAMTHRSVNWATH